MALQLLAAAVLAGAVAFDSLLILAVASDRHAKPSPEPGL